MRTSKGAFSTLQPVQLLRAILYDMAALFAFVAVRAGASSGGAVKAREAYSFGGGGNMKLAT